MRPGGGLLVGQCAGLMAQERAREAQALLRLHVVRLNAQRSFVVRNRCLVFPRVEEEICKFFMGDL